MDSQNQIKETPVSPIPLPVAIILAAGLIAAGLYFGLKSNAGSVGNNAQPPVQATGNLDSLVAVSADDHIRGDPNAPVKIVEFSDTECPFCKRFHTTMQEVMDSYGKDGRVAWVYRHLPLDQLHSRARKEAEATECAAELGGNDAFWAYLDRLMEITPANNGLDPAELPKIAAYVKLDEKKFSECLASGRHAAKIEAQARNAAATGGNGTPWSIVVASNGKKFPLSGAQPLEAVKQLIDVASKEK